MCAAGNSDGIDAFQTPSKAERTVSSLQEDDDRSLHSDWAAPLARTIGFGSGASAGLSSATSGATRINRSPAYKVDHIGRHMRSSKLRHAWTLFLTEDGGTVEVKVELEHSRLSGKKKVLIDGQVVFSTKERCLCWSWEHPRSKARISLLSENGNHSLRCEEPETANCESSDEPAAVRSWAVEDKDFATPLGQRSGRCSDSSRSPSVTPERVTKEAARLGIANGQEPPCSSEEPYAATQAKVAKTEEMAEAGAVDNLEDTLPLPRRRSRSPGPLCLFGDEDDEEVAQEPQPTCPSRHSSFVSSGLVDTTLGSEERARLHALLSVRDAQIAALHSQLLEKSQSQICYDPDATQPVPSVDVIHSQKDLQEFQPQLQQHGQQQQQQHQQQQQQQQRQTQMQQFLVAELPTPRTARSSSSPSAPAGTGAQTAAGEVVLTPAQLARAAVAEAKIQLSLVAPSVGQSVEWDDIDDDELDVTRRRETLQCHGGCVSELAPGAPLLQQGGSSSSTAAVPFFAVAQRPPRENLKTPRKVRGSSEQVLVKVETATSAEPRHVRTGRASSMEPVMVYSRAGGGNPSCGRPERLLSVPAQPRAMSVTPQNSPWIHSRCVTPQRDMTPLRRSITPGPAFAHGGPSPVPFQFAVPVAVAQPVVAVPPGCAPPQGHLHRQHWQIAAAAQPPVGPHIRNQATVGQMQLPQGWAQGHPPPGQQLGPRANGPGPVVLLPPPKPGPVVGGWVPQVQMR